MNLFSLLSAGVLGISVANAILQCWLGLTILLNADRRNWGLWLTTGALLSGSGFFLAQAVASGHGPDRLAMILYLQWPLGWGIGVALPFAWYVAMLLYTGFWEVEQGSLRARHRPLLALCTVAGLPVLGLVFMAMPYPWLRSGQPFALPAIGATPVLAIVYPVFAVLCAVLAVEVLLRPEVSRRVMGDTARDRARPWLIATSILMLLVSLCVEGLMLRVAHRGPLEASMAFPGHMPAGVVVWDLLISSLVALAVLLLGQAVVAYEILAAESLPRDSLRTHWQDAILLAAGYGGLTGWVVGLEGSTFYGILLGALLVTVLYVMANTRAHAARGRYADQLRPFVAGPRVYDALMEPDAPQVDVKGAFAGLCTQVLDAGLAYLVAVGPLSSLVDPPLTHPDGLVVPEGLSELAPRCSSSDQICLAVDPGACGGAMWAVPLWSERGLIGLLLLGTKADGGIYTREEVEIARASGERLIDTVACARMAQRLVALQRRRLAQSQVVDRRARQVLHDDVLPRMHAAMLQLSGLPRDTASGVVEELSDVHRRLSDLLHEIPTPTSAHVERLGLLGALRRMVQDEFAQVFAGVEWDVDERAQERAQAVSGMEGEVVFLAAREAIRNAARHAHGADSARAVTLTITARHHEGLELTVEDDGIGLAGAPDAGAPGHGVALHSTMMAVIGGAWVSDSRPGEYTRVALLLPDAPF